MGNRGARAPIDQPSKILSHMHPISLVYMSRANRQLRRLIRSDMPESIWRDAFQAHSDLPVCPSQISGRRWCKLLFGRNICEVCMYPHF
ncbi:hypothetical protein C8R43DRAFT_902394 [Mycena crocata]|nr:hypothetical protein C8R43DRAFT_902394 [Mycena crocata]